MTPNLVRHTETLVTSTVVFKRLARLLAEADKFTSHLMFTGVAPGDMYPT
jgi:hypothetical protein